MSERHGTRTFYSPDEVPPNERRTEAERAADAEAFAAFNARVRQYDDMPETPRTKYNKRFWWDSADADSVPIDEDEPGSAGSPPPPRP